MDKIKIKYPNRRGKRSIRTCEYCGLIFETLDIKIRADGEKYCSANCYQSYRHDNKMDEKERHSLYQKKYHYGLNEHEYKQMFIDQDNKCAICGTEFSIEQKSAKAHVDHCHESKVVRGLLCTKCNTLLGMAKDNINILESAINYLKTSNTNK